jgi:hypothetical protein
VQLGVSLSWGAATQSQDREKWRKLAARLPLAPVTVETKPISEQARDSLIVILPTHDSVSA